MERTITGSKNRISASIWESTCKKILLAQMEKLVHGRLTILAEDSSISFGVESDDFPVSVHLHVINPAFYPKVVLGGTIGAGESFMDGDWETDNLAGLVRIMVRNREVMEGMDSGISLLKKPFWALFHAFNRNTRAGSERNIAAHYDLGNDFFEKFLDPTMMYSCAYFPDSKTNLHEASIAKLERICRKLDLKEGDRVVEIGTGWGAFAVHAAKNYGCHVTTTTISQNQYDRACRLVSEAGLDNKVTVLKEDYRDLKGNYDKLVSIEMIEAVGAQYLGTYLEKCSNLLHDDGMMLIQAITINDQFYDEAVRSVDFIKRYIFPGSFIPSVSAIVEAMKGYTDLRLFHLEDLTPHYVRTLQNWNANFQTNSNAISAMGYNDAFMRMWEFYFRYCEGGFEERQIGCAHLVFTKQQNRVTGLNY